MPELIDNNMFAPCGMNCMVCYVHLKTKKACSGCLVNDVNKPERCKTCVIKMCAAEKGFTYCYQCSDFPCKRIKNMERSYTKRYGTSLVENSSFVKESGLELFMKQEKEKWICEECGCVVSLHDKECSECGRKYEI